jgi:TrmH family RNA methyltransferase
MITKNQVKYLNSLRMSKFRDLNREFIAEGGKLVDDLLASHFTVKEVYATTEWLASHKGIDRNKNIFIEEVTEDELKRISNMVTANEVFAVVAMPEIPVADPAKAGEVVLLLDRIQDPGNLGTIIRTADWFGIKHIFCSEETADLYNPKVVQATMGSICRVNVHYTALGELITGMKGMRHVYGAFAGGENIYKAEIKFPAAIVIGNESKGISPGLVPIITEKIGIPTLSEGAESLNASVATGILCSEFYRRITSY